LAWSTVRSPLEDAHLDDDRDLPLEPVLRDIGVLAVIASSGLSRNESAHVLHRSLLRELTSGTSQRLGDAIRGAQERFLAEDSFAELLSIYHLFGDPAMPVDGLVRD
jgi:hypothetical protein